MPVAATLESDRSFTSGHETNHDVDRGLILIVDDVRSEREMLAREVEAWGYRPVVAASGKEAIQLYGKHRPPLVLMDIVMPGMDGSAAAQLIRDLAGDDFLALIFLTGLDDATGLRAVVDANSSDFMLKPYDSVLLQSKLRSYERVRILHEETRLQKDEIGRLREYMLNEQEVAKRIIRQVQDQGADGLSGLRHMVRSADILCGDVLLARRRPSGGLNVMIGDLTGHGLAAAVGAMPVAQIFNAMTAKGFSAENVVREINARLGEVLAPGMFCAATLISFSDDGTHADIWNGGMPDLFILDGEQSRLTGRLPSRHLPLGILDANDFDAHMDILELDGCERLFVFSDGLSEAVNADDEFFGEDRLEKLLEDGSALHAFERVSDALKKFCRGAEIRDDISLLEIPCTRETLLQQAGDHHPGVIPVGRPWAWDIKLAADSLANLDPVPVVLQQIITLQGLDPYSDVLFAILSELYNNALDHGVLKLDSSLKSQPEGFEQYYLEREQRLASLEEGSVLIKIANEPMDCGGRLVITVRDSGDGFDYQNLVARWKKQDNVPSGRGLTVVHDLCDRLQFHGNGNCIQASLDWYSDPLKRAQRQGRG